MSLNCPGLAITDGGWGLLTGTADLIAAELALDVATHDAVFHRPWFDLLDDPAGWASHGPDIRPVIQILVDMGGSPVVRG